MKKKIAVALVLSMVITCFAGCGQEATSSTAPKADEVASEEAVEQTQVQAKEQSEETEAIAEGISSHGKENADNVLKMNDLYYGQGVLTDVEVTSRTAQFYNSHLDENSEYAHHDCTLYFIDEGQSVPYMTMDDIVAISNEMFETSSIFTAEDNMYFTGTAKDNIYTVSRTNGASICFDFENNVINLYDFGRFEIRDTAASPVDPIANTMNRYSPLLKRRSLAYVKGNDLTINLNTYGIHLINKDGVYYCPVTTFSDIALAKTQIMLGYNTQDLFNTSEAVCEVGGSYTPYGEIFYNVTTPEKRSKELIAYNYSELCLACDFHYGLKEGHGITNFNEYFVTTGLDQYLLSDNIEDCMTGYFELAFNYLGDGHSAITAVSPFEPQYSYNALINAWLGGATVPADVSATVLGTIVESAAKTNGNAYRAAIYGEDVPMPYSEIGDTAFVTFDGFHYKHDCDYSTCEPENDESDTVKLILYAHSQITRENSPIKNVVLNLANNGGGEENAAAIVISWFAGANATINITNMTTGEAGITGYVFDANRDGVFDAAESLADLGYNLFCVVSNTSFSCGNIVPVALKGSGKVIILGTTTGGGACAVQPLTTADGVTYRVSAQFRIDFAKNGSYYNADEGVVPDVYIANKRNLFDNEYLANLVHELVQ